MGVRISLDSPGLADPCLDVRRGLIRPIRCRGGRIDFLLNRLQPLLGGTQFFVFLLSRLPSDPERARKCTLPTRRIR